MNTNLPINAASVRKIQNIIVINKLEKQMKSLIKQRERIVKDGAKLEEKLNKKYRKANILQQYIDEYEKQRNLVMQETSELDKTGV